MRRIMVAGMPSSGKSTFIAALRHVLLSDDTASALKMSKPAGDERHLNRIQDRWLASETFDRTREASEAWVQFHVVDRSSGAEAEIAMPDLRGETFERPAELGSCARDVFEGLTSAASILLFTSANRPDDANLISDTGDLLDAEDAAQEDETARLAIAYSAFRPDLMPEEAKLVELLQSINRRPNRRRRRKLAVGVSAWDIVHEGGDLRTPQAWLAASRPMLWQFLQNNEDLWEVRIYGISAQGGALPRHRVRLQSIEKASERIMIIGHDAAPHDPTAPVAWLVAGT